MYVVVRMVSKRMFGLHTLSEHIHEPLEKPQSRLTALASDALAASITRLRLLRKLGTGTIDEPFGFRHVGCFIPETTPVVE